MPAQSKKVLRLDDVGAASKQNEQYARLPWRFGGKNLPTPFFLNWGNLKRMPSCQGWGVYPEMTPEVWHRVFDVLRAHGGRISVGVTASWVENSASLTPFNEKYPNEAAILREGVEEGLVEIANHGLTHCVLANNAYLPKRFASNRLYHREFWPWVPEAVQNDHIMRAQEILTNWFGVDIVTLIPPGSVWTDATEIAAHKAGLKYLSVSGALGKTGQTSNGLLYVSTDVVLAIHDRDIMVRGVEWFNNLLKQEPEARATVRDYAEKISLAREEEGYAQIS